MKSSLQDILDSLSSCTNQCQCTNLYCKGCYEGYDEVDIIGSTGHDLDK